MPLPRLALMAVVCLADGLFLLKVTPAADIVADIAPPPPRAENVGHSRDGYVFAPGHWDWSGHGYAWVSGSWIVQHGKARWIADQWESQGTQWRFVPGHWQR
jgi:hypothetical protein